MAKVPCVVTLYYSVSSVSWSVLLIVHNEKRLLFKLGPSTSTSMVYGCHFYVCLHVGTLFCTLNDTSVAY